MDEELYHHGVKGMKWGVRRAERKTRKQARKDAQETARSKMYYGEGAGVRRRNINAVVRQRSKDPTYKKAFDEEYAKQDMGKARRDAERQRKTTDRVEPIKTGIGRGVKKAVRAGLRRQPSPRQPPRQWPLRIIFPIRTKARPWSGILPIRRRKPRTRFVTSLVAPHSFVR